MEKKEIKKLVCIFFIGLVVGVIFLNSTNIENKKNILDYIQNYINTIKEVNISNILNIENIFRNSIILMLIFLSSFFIFGKVMIYVLNFFKGFILGYTISAITGCFGIGNGILVSTVVLLGQNLIEIPLIIIFSLAATEIIKDIKSINNNEKVRKKVIRFIILYLFTECINITSLLINVYISSNFVKIIKIF